MVLFEILFVISVPVEIRIQKASIIIGTIKLVIFENIFLRFCSDVGHYSTIQYSRSDRYLERKYHFMWLMDKLDSKVLSSEIVHWHWFQKAFGLVQNNLGA